MLYLLQFFADIAAAFHRSMLFCTCSDLLLEGCWINVQQSHCQLFSVVSDKWVYILWQKHPSKSDTNFISNWIKQYHFGSCTHFPFVKKEIVLLCLSCVVCNLFNDEVPVLYSMMRSLYPTPQAPQQPMWFYSTSTFIWVSWRDQNLPLFLYLPVLVVWLHIWGAILKQKQMD